MPAIHAAAMGGAAAAGVRAVVGEVVVAVAAGDRRAGEPMKSPGYRALASARSIVTAARIMQPMITFCIGSLTPA